MPESRYILTIATGKEYYINLAVNLARSFLWWHHDSNIKFKIVTDKPEYLPVDLKDKIDVHHIQRGELGIGFSPKLHLDKLADEGQTLFIDSDCLIFGRLEHVFDLFKGHKVSVVGTYISKGEWFGDIRTVCDKFNVPHLPKFNGGIYYIEKGPEATAVYETARLLEKQYDEIGFVRLRNQPNDELVMALAMQLHKQTPVTEDGTILGEFVNFQSGVKSDLLKGKIELYNNPGHKKYQKNWPLTIGRPVVVHFLGYHSQLLPYVKEVKQLQYLCAGKWSKWAARTVTAIQITLPFQMITLFKTTFRPLYRALFGTREIKKSERIPV